MSRNRRGSATVDSEVGVCQCKVGRSADQYGITDLDSELVERWVGTESDSLRDLERYVNVRLVRAALEAADNSVIDGEPANYYRLLTDSDTSEGTRVEARRRLERQGIDVDRLQSSFVSHQTIHTHLRECLEVEYDRSTDPADRADNARKFLQGVQSRTERITGGTLEQLRASDILDLDEFSVYVDLMVSCDACGRVLSLGDIFENSGCVCQQSD